MIEQLSGDLERYIRESEAVAGDILRESGHDPATLFDVVTDGTGRYVRYSKIDRNSLSPEANHALDILRFCHLAQADLDDRTAQDALWRGIHLAQANGYLNTNIVLAPLVKGRKNSDDALAKNRPRGQPAKIRKRILDCSHHFPDDLHRASRIAKRVGCDPSYVRKILKEK